MPATETEYQFRPSVRNAALRFIHELDHGTSDSADAAGENFRRTKTTNKSYCLF